MSSGATSATHDFHIFWSFLPEAADALHHAGDLSRGIRSAGGAELSRA